MRSSSSSFMSFTQCSPTCGRMPLPALSPLWPGRQPCRHRLVDGRRGGGPSSVAPRSRNPPTGRHEVKHIYKLEMVQRRAARWTVYLLLHHTTSSVKGMLEDMQWRTLEQRHTDCRLVVLLQIVHGLIQIPPTNYLQHILQKQQLYILLRMI